MSLSAETLEHLAAQIKLWAQELGFQQAGICDIDLSAEEPKLLNWLKNNYHGNMDYMARHGLMRVRPAELLPGTIRVISVRMDYLPEDAQFASDLDDANVAYISRYALGRDYHKLLRSRLKKLGQKIQQEIKQEVGFRPFVDSAPILERPLAAKAALGWIGKHSLLLTKEAGSWYFLGELLIDLPLPVEPSPVDAACGSCTACITMCPTQAIVEPYIVDARRCISYLTIELDGVIPVEFRQAIGNRIYGCDDCQLVCPWNRYAELSCEADFQKRSALANQSLLTLWHWDEATFLKNTEGSAIRRIGYQRWMRNLAVGLGNAPYSEAVITALTDKRAQLDEIVQEHIDWALAQQQAKQQEQLKQSSKQKRLIRIIEKGLPRDA